MVKSLLSCLLLFLLVSTTTSASKILMRFCADDDYSRPVGLDGKQRLETYTFYIGKYYPSATETKEEAIPFETVARILVEQLATLNYQMVQEAKEADYILLLNWGQTTPESDLEEVEYAGIEDDDDLFTLEVVPEQKQRENAKLLGTTKMYDMSQISLKKQLLREAIAQDRYFINLYAVSIDAIKSRKGKSEKVTATWECQLSVPTGTMDEETAFKTMAATGSNYFGTNVDDITFMKAGTKQGVATIGDINYLETVEEGENVTMPTSKELLENP